MNEEIMAYEEIENAEVVAVDNEPETSEGISLGKIILIGGAIIAGTIAVAHFTKKKREEYQINKLRNKGYIISKPEEIESEEDDFEDNDDAE